MPSSTFNYTGGWRYFKVPAGVKQVSVQIRGAGSGSAKGGRVTGNLAVTPGQTLCLVIGEAGNLNNGVTAGAQSWGSGGAGGKGVGHQGGDSGGGYSAIRLNSTDGRILAVAGGAGGTSGDGGLGGDGGTSTGQSGFRGTLSPGGGATYQPTGGTQTQGGAGGTTVAGPSYYGGNPSNTALSRAGAGGTTDGTPGNGGGGGGGGWMPGGGGQGGSWGYAPAGGGAGGSNYYTALSSATSARGYATGNGQIIISWSSPAPATQAPNTASLVAPEQGKRTLSTGKVTFTANLSDPAKRKVRLHLVIADNPQFKNAFYRDSGYVKQGASDSYKTVSLAVTGLKQDAHYYVHLYAQNDKGYYSKGYSSTDFYTNARPGPPPLYLPANGYQTPVLAPLTFTWGFVDPDGGSQSLALFRFRIENGGNWHDFTVNGNNRTITLDGATLSANTFYVWQVRSRDAGGLYSEWSEQYRFFVAGTSVPPRLLSPINDQAVQVNDPVTLDWKFVDPDQGDAQVKADIRYRVVGTADWTVVFGDTAAPGALSYWTLPARTFQVGFRYEWSARTYDLNSGGFTASSWTEPETFYAIATPGAVTTGVPVIDGAYRSTLGIGTHRVMVVTKGGKNLLGEISHPTYVQWGRVRDDISKALVRVNVANDSNLTQLIAMLRTWQHELKIFRSTGEGTSQVWEGPITRIEIIGDAIEIEAQDPMVWVYRRIMRQGYSDAYPGIRTVVERAARIIINALAPDDPNILPYLTRFDYPDDSKQSRVRPSYSSTAWEEVDDLAAKAGLDYTVVGRRIILNDTHRPIGRLPTLTNKDFLAELVVTEYGMNLATEYAVTNGAGVYGRAYRSNTEYGLVELLASAYGEQAAAQDETLTAAARSAMVSAFAGQAERNIAHRWPAPRQVRVPDGTGLNPQASISIDHLVPGVWIPLLAEGIRPMSQVQKLDVVDVTEQDGVETVAVTMQPAPNGGQDPDADTAVAEEASA